MVQLENQCMCNFGGIGPPAGDCLGHKTLFRVCNGCSALLRIRRRCTGCCPPRLSCRVHTVSSCCTAVGGNHEAANHLWELYYGGWVAPNIYYLGAAGVVNFGGVRIAGLSGIFNPRHYKQVGQPPAVYSSSCSSLMHDPRMVCLRLRISPLRMCLWSH